MPSPAIQKKTRRLHFGSPEIILSLIASRNSAYLVSLGIVDINVTAATDTHGTPGITLEAILGPRSPTRDGADLVALVIIDVDVTPPLHSTGNLLRWLGTEARGVSSNETKGQHR